jgi:plastocyanin
MEPELQQRHPFFGTAGNIILVLLVLVALLISFMLYQRLGVAPVETFDFQPLSENERETLDAVVTTPPGDGVFTDTAPVMTSDGLALASSPKIAQAAVSAAIVALGADCKVSPVVVKAKKGTMLQFKNYDDAPHTIMFSSEHELVVPAHDAATLTLDFGRAGEAYYFGCEADPMPIGVLWLAE